MKVFLMFLILNLSACASKLTPEQASIRILRKSDAPAECVEIQKVESGKWSRNEQGREDDLKRAAFNIGADTVTLDRFDQFTNASYGTAYKCKNQ